jgi:hypothetical protein
MRAHHQGLPNSDQVDDNKDEWADEKDSLVYYSGDTTTLH